MSKATTHVIMKLRLLQVVQVDSPDGVEPVDEDVVGDVPEDEDEGHVLGHVQVEHGHPASGVEDVRDRGGEAGRGALKKTTNTLKSRMVGRL